MEKKLRFYRCEECGHMVVSVDTTEHPISCCGEKLKEVTALEHDGAVEKHLPVVEREADAGEGTGGLGNPPDDAGTPY